MSLIEDDNTVSCDLLVAEKNLKISTAEDASRICDAINQLNELKTLKLEGISLGIEAAEAIADSISHCPSLEVKLLRFQRKAWSLMFPAPKENISSFSI